jgi:hypothetical protein
MPTSGGPLPVPGWLSEHIDTWRGQREAYRQSCRDGKATDEISYLDKLRLAAQQLVALSETYTASEASKRDALVLIDKLRGDIATCDILTAQLAALPSCGDDGKEPAPSAAPTVMESPPSPPSDTPASSDPEHRFVIRFDDRVPALTPLGIHTFAEALRTLKGNAPVQLQIDGCGKADVTVLGSVCARRLLSLATLLEENGVNRPSRFLGEYGGFAK